MSPPAAAAPFPPQRQCRLRRRPIHVPVPAHAPLRTIPVRLPRPHPTLVPQPIRALPAHPPQIPVPRRPPARQPVLVRRRLPHPTLVPQPIHALPAHSEERLITGADLARAAQEALFCERILAKSGENVLSATLVDAASVQGWSHYPASDVFDPASGAQWYYHCHVPSVDGIEHGHFHCFLRPGGANGPVHHLVAVGVNAYGALHRLFTVNQWVVGDTWLDAEQTVALLPRFDVQLAKPSYLVNRWLTAVLRLYEAEIAGLIRERDKVLAGHSAPAGVAVLDDRNLEVTSSLMVNLSERARELGA